MPRFGELQASQVWTSAARTLTDISAEDIFDLPLFVSAYPPTVVNSSATNNTFGSWTELVANVGAGRRLIYVNVVCNGSGSFQVEVEIGEGAAGAEAAIARFPFRHQVTSNVGHNNPIIIPVWRTISDNARLSVRIRNDGASSVEYLVAVMYV